MATKKRATKRRPATKKKKATRKRSAVGAITNYTRAVYGNPAVRKAKRKIAEAERQYKTAVKNSKASYNRKKK